MFDSANQPAAALQPSAQPKAAPLVAGWRTGRIILNLRGNPLDANFGRAIEAMLGLPLPEPKTVRRGSLWQVLWSGPDEFIVVGRRGDGEPVARELDEKLAGTRHAVTDVSSGYSVLSLSGPRARDMLAQGSPLDLHARVFRSGDCVGTHFFKAGILLWQPAETNRLEVLVRRSFCPYVSLMLGRCAAEHGLLDFTFS